MKNRLVAVMSALFFASAPACADSHLPAQLRDALQKAVDASPEVLSRWHAFRVVENQQDVARGEYLPSVDVSAGVGREYLKRPGESRESFNRRGATIGLNQMLYDGMFTRNEVARLGHAKLTRYFELLEAVQDTSLETFKAYVDVLRYRDLVQATKENYVEHKLVYDQIVDRTQAGVGRGVDLEQATGRLALAESNLLTEAANLHDVSARYVRLVGEKPSEDAQPIDPAMLSARLPTTIGEVLNTSFAENPALKTALANIRASQAQVDTVRSAFRPRLDLRASQSAEHNLDGNRGRTNEGVVELVMTYNLYRGGADQARLRQAAEEVNISRDLREKACRDLRQTVSIAYNDVQQLREQMAYLDQHQLSTGKARQAYRQQFDIGQRSLLDLLDTENEYFEARRAYINASYNKLLAEARSLAGMGRLLTALDVTRSDLPAVSQLADESDYVDAASLCPPEAPGMLVVDKEALFEEAMQTLGAGRR